MLIIFNKSGNEFNVDFQYDSFSQGDSNVHIVDVILEDTTFSNYEYNAYVQFLREGEKEPSPKLVMVQKRILHNDTYYNGYTYSMESDWFTAIAGTLKMTIEIKKYSNGALQSNKAYGVVNIPIQPSVSAQADVDSKITDEEYSALMELINSKLAIADEKILRADTIFSNDNDFYDWCFEQGETGTNPPYRIYYGSVVDNNGTNDLVAILDRYIKRLLVLDSSYMGGIMVIKKDHTAERIFADTDFVNNAVANVKTQLEEDYNSKINQLDLIKANDGDVVHNNREDIISASLRFDKPIKLKEEVVDPRLRIKRASINIKNNSKQIVGYIRTTMTDEGARDLIVRLNNGENASNITFKEFKITDEGAYYTNDYTNNKLATDSDIEHVKLYADNLVKNIIDNAPETLDTFKEIADYIASDKTGASQMTASINKNKQDIATNTNQINALENNKLDKEDLVYENVENAPEKINIVVRDVISADTYNEAREIQIGRDKFKFGSGSKIKANEFVDGTLPTLEYLNIDGNTYRLPNYVVDKSGLKLVAEGIGDANGWALTNTLEDNKLYVAFIDNDMGDYTSTAIFSSFKDQWDAYPLTMCAVFDSEEETLIYGYIGLDTFEYLACYKQNKDTANASRTQLKIYEIPLGESAQVEKHNKTINALMQRVSDLEQKAGLTSVGYVQDSTLNLIRVNVVDDVLEVSGFKFDGEVMII